MNKRSSWALPYFIFLVLFVVLPLLLILMYSLQDASGNFTLSNITKFFTDKDALGTAVHPNRLSGRLDPG